MNEFQKARIKLTILYIFLSALMLGGFTFTAVQSERRAFNRIESILSDRAQRPNLSRLLENRLRAFNSDFIGVLMRFNIILLFLSSVSSYFLSGYTLKSIQEMVQKQEEFSQDASHELRTPLTTINMEIESIKRVDKDSYEKNKKTFESIQEEVQRMKKLTEGLLTLVRKDDSNSLTKFSLNELLEESSEQMRKSAEEKSITLSIELGKESGITANRDQVKQVLMILLDNAIKYTNAGGKITIQETQEKKSVKVQITDTGIGIPQKDLKHIFDRFYRVRNNKAAGSGLGLAIAKRLVELNNGKIWAESQEGKGTSFFLSFS